MASRLRRGQGVRRRRVAAPSASGPASAKPRTTTDVAPDRRLVGRPDQLLHRVDGVGQRQHVADRLEHARQRVARRRRGRTAGSAGARPAGMNWTAWNSVVAKALTNRPSAVPSTASTTATTPSSQTGPLTSSPSRPTLTADRQRRLDRGEQAEGEGVAEQEVELAQRHREQPLEGAAAALAQGGHAGDEEHHDEREDRQQARPEAVEGRPPGTVLEHPPQQADQHARDRPAASRACGGRGGSG